VHTRLYLDSAPGNTDGAGQADRPRQEKSQDRQDNQD
jgi:hypothetical protein